MRKKKKPANNIRKDVSFKKKGVARKKKTVASKRIKVPKTRNAETMTEAQYFQRVRSALRAAFRYWKPAMLALEAASRPYTGTARRLKKEYMCAGCEEWFDRKSVEIDHKEECGSLNCYEDITLFLQRLTPEDVGAFQILCKSCHVKKTKDYKETKKKAA
jgi:hypothetical protein